MKKYLLFIIIILLLISVIFGFLYWKNKNNQIERYGVVLKYSPSGDMRFSYYDIQQEKVLNSWEGYPWFFATVKDLENDKSVDDFSNYVKSNEDSVFKITGTKEKDDCDYYGNGTCLENITIKKIEIVADKESQQRSLNIE